MFKKLTAILTLLIFTITLIPMFTVPAAEADDDIVPAVAAGGWHTVALDEDGVVWTWGKNSSGQLGVGHTGGNENTPQHLGLANIQAIAAGGEHTVALDQNGRVWTWGENGKGQLGDNSTADKDTPQRLGLTNIKAIAAGDEHTVALGQNGRVWTWGDNGSGQLGIERIGGKEDTPQRVDNISNIEAIAAGGDHTVALGGNGEVWAWGENGSGQVGDHSIEDRDTPQSLNLANIKAIAAGGNHTVALDQDNRVWTWGANGSGQLGDSTTGKQLTPWRVIGISDIVVIAAGTAHTVAVDDRGAVWAWGDNEHGRLGVRNDDRLVPKRVTGIDDVKTITAGGSHTVAVDDQNQVWAWGNNSSGQLGDVGRDFDLTGEIIPEPRISGLGAITIPAAGEPAATEDYTVTFEDLEESGGTVSNINWRMAEPPGVSWEQVVGNDAEITVTVTVADTTEPGSFTLEVTADFTKEVTAGFTNAAGDPPIPISAEKTVHLNHPPLGKTIEKIAAGEYHTVALDTEGFVWTWGSNDSGQLGISLEERDYGVLSSPVRTNLANIAEIAAGKKHTIALDQDGYVWTWGNNEQGQLGDGGTENRLAPQRLDFSRDIVEITAGAYHTLARDKNGRVWAWGANWHGQLGDGTTVARLTPRQVKNISNITKIAAGDEHSVALAQDDRVWTWGRHNRGQLGNITAVNNVSTPQPVETLRNVTNIAAGANHTIATDEFGQVWTWGANWFGQLGIYEPADPATIGDQNTPQRVKTIMNIAEIEAGDHHTVVVDGFGEVWAWGNNRSGQLGDGTNIDQRAPQNLADLPRVAQVAAGAQHTVALDEDGEVWTWGDNEHGQLGDRAFSPRNTPQVIIIDFGLAPLLPQVEIFGASSLCAPAEGAGEIREIYTVIVRDERGTMLSREETEAIIPDGLLEWTLEDAPPGVAIEIAADGFSDTTRILVVEPGVLEPGDSAITFTLRVEAPLDIFETELPIIATKEITLKPRAEELILGPLEILIPSAGAAAREVAYAIFVDGQRLTEAEIVKLEGVSINWSLIEAPAGVALVPLAEDEDFTVEQKIRVPPGVVPGQVTLQLDVSLVWERADGIKRTLSGIATKEITLMPPDLVKIKIDEVAAGEYHTVALDAEGYVWTWGNNDSGQLGISLDTLVAGDQRVYARVEFPVRTNLDNIRQIAAGKKHTVALDQDGYVWTWGNNEQGQLGDDSTENRLVPHRLDFADNIIEIAAGAYHTLALDRRGQVWAWGANWCGQLGDGTTVQRLTPQQLAKLVYIDDLAAGDEHSVALTENGDLLTWGRNNSGQLGNEQRGTNDFQTVPAYVDDLDDLEKIAAGANHTVVLDEDDRIWTWGANQHGQLGLGIDEDELGDQDEPQRVKKRNFTAIAAGDHHTVAVGRGYVWTWGDNRFGQLGLEDEDDDFRITNKYQPEKVAALSDRNIDIEKIAAGARHTVAVDHEGRVWVWGGNDFGQLGDGTFSQRNAPRMISIDFKPAPLILRTEIFGATTLTIPAAGAEALTETYTVIIRNEYGTMLSAQEIDTVIIGRVDWNLEDAPAGVVDKPVETGFSETTRILEVNPGATPGQFILRVEARLATDAVTGIPIIATKEITLLPPAMVKAAVDVVTGKYHTVVLDSSGSIWTWGANRDGQLGDGSTADRAEPRQFSLPGGVDVAELAAGAYHNIALDEDGFVWTWGNNQYGQLGNGNTGNILAPQRINLTNIVAVAAGAYHTAAVDKNGYVWTWGNNEHGQLGDGTSGKHLQKLTPRRINLAGIETIAAGGWHTVALNKQNQVWAWGGNWHGQLGLGSIDNKTTPRRVSLPAIEQLAAGDEHTVALDNRGRVWTWGNNRHGQLGSGTSGGGAFRPLPAPVNLASVEMITAGSAHTATVGINNLVWIWGNNQHGQLGDGNSGLGVHHAMPRQVFFNDASIVAAGEWHTVALDEAGHLWSWGSNQYGQLGDGSIGEGLYKSIPQRADLVNIVVN